MARFCISCCKVAMPLCKMFKKNQFVSVLRDCGGNITGDEGVVSSPNYPANYDNLRVCEWRITVEDTFNVRVEVHELDIPYSYYWYGCTGDSLMVRPFNRVNIRRKTWITKDGQFHDMASDQGVLELGFHCK